MATSNIGNRKHLTLSDRIQIETGLEKGMNFTQIAKLLHKDSSTAKLPDFMRFFRGWKLYFHFTNFL